MKQVHYLLIAKHLTDDSEVLFFKTRLEAEKEYINRVKPLLDICKSNNLVEEENFEFFSDWGVRFNGGDNSDLDALLSGGVNHYFMVNTISVEDDVTHYFAEFMEWVDDSKIILLNEKDAINMWESRVNNDIEEANLDIDRTDEKTWEGKDGRTIFSLINNSAYFGHDDDVTWTYKYGKINFAY